MQMIFSFVLAGDLSASKIGVDVLTSILCRSKCQIGLNLSWKYSTVFLKDAGGSKFAR